MYWSKYMHLACNASQSMPPGGIDITIWNSHTAQKVQYFPIEIPQGIIIYGYVTMHQLAGLIFSIRFLIVEIQVLCPINWNNDKISHFIWHSHTVQIDTVLSISNISRQYLAMYLTYTNPGHILATFLFSFFLGSQIAKPKDHYCVSETIMMK